MNTDNFKNRITSTGGYDGECIFKMLTITENEYKTIEDNNISLKELSNELQIDFICVERKENINILHITETSNKKPINKNGLIINNSDFTYDLGNGIYCVLDTNNPFYDGIENLKDYVLDGFDSNKILIVKGNYEDEYIECVYGKGHEGYIVLKNNVSKTNIDDLEIIKTENFLYKY
ncbi:MAG: hypothetical protein PHT02_01185 [Tissierellia bacterium]|nr:hypothetical protein [Tissierellia bacterium]